ncbi:hypothetical protein V8E54_002142 [Elaphomyces granulatus]
MDEATSKQFLKRIEALPKFRRQWVLKQLLKLAEKESTPLALMDKIMSEQKMTASADPRYITKLFSIKKSKHPLMIGEEESSMHAVPQQAIPTIPTRHPRGNDDDIRMPLEIYPECDLKTEVQHSLTKETVAIVVTGQADWAVGYDGRASAETLLLCACGEAMQGKTFGEAESQLLLRSVGMSDRNMGNWCRASKGFEPTAGYTNFRVCHRRPGTLYYVFDVRDDKHLRIVYNVIIQQIQTAIELLPSTTLVKGSVDEKRKAGRHSVCDRIFWGGVFDPPPAPSEDDELPDDPPF